MEQEPGPKAGGGVTVISLDELHAEERYSLEPADQLMPDKVYERRWVETIIDSVTHQLRDEFVSAILVCPLFGLDFANITARCSALRSPRRSAVRPN